MISVCHEPGCHTIFQEASPTFKKRFMYMSGITDEAEFDKMRQGMTWEGHADKVKVPYLCVAGEFDELSPIEHSVRLVEAVKGPKRMVVYQESRHSVGNVPAANLGPFPPILVADWLADRVAGKPFAERALVRARDRPDRQEAAVGIAYGRAQRVIAGLDPAIHRAEKMDPRVQALIPG